MSREIKFRAWDGEKMFLMVELTIDGWVHSWGDTGENSESIAVGSIREGSVLKSVNLMQYTGLKDKNGVEIYEGDILQTYIDGGYNKHSIKVVEWKQVSSRVGFNIGIGNKPVDRCINLEVIGNIYENPNLLKESK